MIHIYGGYAAARADDAESTSVRIAYSREKEERDRPGKNEDDWKCDMVGIAYSKPVKTNCFSAFL